MIEESALHSMNALGKPAIYWSLSNHGGSGIAREPDTLAACSLLAAQADLGGIDGVLVTTAPGSWDAWSIAAYLAASTKRLHFLIAHYTGANSPLLLAQQAATLSALTSARIQINAVSGRSRVRAYGGKLTDGAYESSAARQYWLAWRELLEECLAAGRAEQFGMVAPRLRIPAAEVRSSLVIAGASEESKRLAAQVGDAWVFNARSYDAVGQAVSTFNNMRADLEQNRQISVGIRLHVLIRNTEKESWEAAKRISRLLSGANADSGGSTASARMLNIVGENLWNGVAEFASGPGLTIVGTPLQVRRSLKRFSGLGVSFFVLSGYDNRQELSRFLADVRMPCVW